MNILVLGGTGFVGPHVVRRLHADGHALTLLHRGTTTTADLPPGVAHLHADWAALAEQRTAIARLAPEAVLFMVPIGEADSRRVVDALRGTAGRLVAISSMDVYRAYGRIIGTEPGPPDPVPLTEDAPLREKRFPYRPTEPDPDANPEAPRPWSHDYDKILAEDIVMNEPTLPGTVLRLPMVHGPGDKQRRFRWAVQRMDDGRPAILLGEAQARWRAHRGYVENIAAAIAAAVVDPRAAGKTYNLGEPDAPTEGEWVRLLAETTGWTGRVVVLPPDRLPAHLRDEANLDQDLAADTGRFRRDLGFAEPISRAEGLIRTVAWERSNPPVETDPAAFDYAAEDAALGG